jgi:hypothetical protein
MADLETGQFIIDEDHIQRLSTHIYVTLGLESVESESVCVGNFWKTEDVHCCSSLRSLLISNLYFELVSLDQGSIITTRDRRVAVPLSMLSYNYIYISVCYRNRSTCPMWVLL